MALTLQQSMMLLAFAADTQLTTLTGDSNADETFLFNQLQTSVLPEINKSADTSWSVVWGPWVKTEPYVKWHDQYPSLEFRIVNVLYAAQNGSRNEFVLGIAGTDFRSAYDWLIEDADVKPLVGWNQIASKTSAPQNASVSPAAKTAMGFLLNGTPTSTQVKGTGTTIQQFLATLPLNATIYTTGHSLGGSLSEMTALWIVDQNATGKTAATNPFSYAGPTPGNDVFAKYYGQRLSNLQRVWNQADLVPHAWNKVQLGAYVVMLAASNITDRATYATAITGVATDTANLNYTQAPGGIMQNNKLDPKYTSFLCQVYVQHIVEYYTLNGLPVPQDVLNGMPKSCSQTV